MRFLQSNEGCGYQKQSVMRISSADEVFFRYAGGEAGTVVFSDSGGV